MACCLSRQMTKQSPSIFFSVEGLHAIVVSDRDGVPVIKGKEESKMDKLVNCPFAN